MFTLEDFALGLQRTDGRGWEKRIDGVVERWSKKRKRARMSVVHVYVGEFRAWFTNNRCIESAVERLESIEKREGGERSV